ncbi:type VII secretion integral membrane protein EccD [Nocardiopsis sp. RSe5-2]|uniref:Type VII secretion integral membrane protein EccD n=1 Tax=Nocardiopsis endophytica TaxID=3018445 RepID=A0ABT4TYD8_9ACTN|nr:type VII secretion integral membrane protein EccD [Nocardiopsis endophytica]MDA2809710.1 type VII secretion integral membrane protein EccD [Nocardiopsis endophytica]
MTTWSRVTLVGERRRVDAVLPADEPIGALMPDVLRMLGDAPDGPALPRHLSTVGGDLLDSGTSLAERDISDGAVLRLIRADDPVPAPIVHEVPEAVGRALEAHPSYWSPAAARWTATAAVVALTAGAGLIMRGTLPPVAGTAALAVLAGLLIGAGALLGSAWKEPLGTALTLSGGVFGILAAWTAVPHYGLPEWTWWALPGVIASLVLLLLGLTSRLGRGGIVGGSVSLVLSLLWIGCLAFGLDFAEASAIAAVACVVAVSVLLRAALAFSGLTVLDDRRSGGEEVAREDVRTALVDTHRSMVVAVAAVGVAAAVAGYGLADDPSPWTLVLSALLAIVLASRSRMFPLVTEKAPLLAASTAAAIALAAALTEAVPWAPLPGLALIAVALIVPVVVLAADPAEHTRAMLRRNAGRLEAVAVVVCIPVAIGALGTYERLLSTF